MAEVPENEVTQQDLAVWYDLQQELKRVKAKEILLRKKIFGNAFPSPDEGTNSFPLNDGYVLKGKYSLQRDIDQGAFDAIKDKLRETKVNPDLLVQYKPSLVLREYRKLTEDQQLLFDECLIIKPGSPSLEIVLPKKANKGKGAA
jgi:hypothetical protein